MTDRLKELNRGSNSSSTSSIDFTAEYKENSVEIDIENGDVELTMNSALAEASMANLEGEELTEEREKQVILETFNKEIDALTRAIERIEGNVKCVDEKYKMSMMKSSIRQLTTDERTEISAHISILVTQTAKTAQAVRKRLRRIADENEQFAQDHPNSPSALRIRVTTHQAITQKFMYVMQKLEDTQEKHRESIRSVVERQLRHFNPNATDEDIQIALQRAEVNKQGDNNHNDSPLLCELPEEEQKKLREQLDLLTSRNNDIRKLEQNVVDLHQMFMDMKLLVNQQGDLLNTIEYNLQETKGRAEAGMQELIQAHDFQRKANRKKWCIVFLIIVIIISISIPIFLKYKSVIMGTNSSDTDEGNEIVGNQTAIPTPTNVPTNANANANGATGSSSITTTGNTRYSTKTWKFHQTLQRTDCSTITQTVSAVNASLLSS